jgi:hypothetical protein
LAQIDWVISRLPPISTNLLELKNSLAPINRLPPEVLALIPAFRGSERDLINATAVCKRWRRTLVSTPSLWNNIICFKRERLVVIAPHIRAYLERSRSVPVNAQIHVSSSRLLSPHAERISSLRVFMGNYPSNVEALARHFSKPTPLLEAISLQVQDGDRTLVLPPLFFDAFLSSVRTFTLEGATLAPGSCRLSRLTKFTLETCIKTSVPCVALLDSLAQMTLLQVFEVKLYCGHPPDAVPRNRVVTLPHLEEITITTNGQLIGPLENPISPVLCLPNARRVNIHSINAIEVPPTPILPLSFEQRLPGLSATPEVSVTLGRELNIELCGLHQSKLTLSIDAILHSAISLSMFGGAPFGSVRKLHVRLPRPPVDVKFFVKMLRVMRKLEWLGVEQGTEKPLTYWAEAVDQAEICPALTTLIITDADTKRAKRCIRELGQARRRDGVPIAYMEIGNR